MTDFEVREIQEFLEQKIRGITPGNLSLKGLAGSAVYFPIASFVNKAPCRIHVLILENSTEASYAAADLSVLLGYERVYLFPASYRGTGKTARPDESFQVQRTICLLYTSDAADDLLCVDLGGRRSLKKTPTSRPCAIFPTATV